jgi:hypothetical protein
MVPALPSRRSRLFVLILGIAALVGGLYFAITKTGRQVVPPAFPAIIGDIRAQWSEIARAPDPMGMDRLQRLSDLLRIELRRLVDRGAAEDVILYALGCNGMDNLEGGAFCAQVQSAILTVLVERGDRVDTVRLLAGCCARDIGGLTIEHGLAALFPGQSPLDGLDVLLDALEQSTSLDAQSCLRLAALRAFAPHVQGNDKDFERRCRAWLAENRAAVQVNDGYPSGLNSFGASVTDEPLLVWQR